MNDRAGLPVHPITGLTAIGYKKNGSPIWPVMGGDGTMPNPGSDAGLPLVENGNPAWNEFLEPLPEDLRPTVVPVLQKWDQGVQQKFQQVHSEYEPWKDIVKSGMDPETVQFATEVLAAMQEDPRKIYDSLGEHFGWSGEEDGVQPPEEDDLSGQGQEFEFDLEQHPAFQQIAQQNRVMADILLAQKNQNDEAAAEAAFDAEWNATESELGKFSDEQENFMLMYLQANDEASVKDAAVAYSEFTEKIGVRRPAPKLHGGSGGGGAPAPRVDVRKLSEKEARQMFTRMLTDAREG